MTQQPASDMSFEAGAATALVDLRCGGRLSSLRVDGLDLLAHNGDAPTQWGCFVMAPFAGRLDRGLLRIDGTDHQLPLTAAPHAMHGTVVEAPAVAVDAATVRMDLGPVWPVAGHVLHRVELSEDRLTLRLEVHSDDRSFPASCGWHPWFPRRLGGADVEITLSATSMLARGADGLPDGRRITPPPSGPWDDCFEGITAPTVLEWPGVLRLRIDSDADYLVVYDEQADAVCVEPQTAPPDDLAFTVEPGHPLVTTTTWHWERP
ncbi:MAG: aldose 1-epimerase [Acidimicrobiales bacterium]